jgi:hypothetical protein
VLLPDPLGPAINVICPGSGIRDWIPSESKPLRFMLWCLGCGSANQRATVRARLLRAAGSGGQNSRRVRGVWDIMRLVK